MSIVSWEFPDGSGGSAFCADGEHAREVAGMWAVGGARVWIDEDMYAQGWVASDEIDFL